MRTGRVVCRLRRDCVDLKLEAHDDREDASEGARRVVACIKVCDIDRVWYIICRSIVMCVGVMERTVGKQRDRTRRSHDQRRHRFEF
jgi:hypothetical protein